MLRLGHRIAQLRIVLNGQRLAPLRNGLIKILHPVVGRTQKHTKVRRLGITVRLRRQQIDRLQIMLLLPQQITERQRQARIVGQVLERLAIFDDGRLRVALARQENRGCLEALFELVEILGGGSVYGVVLQLREIGLVHGVVMNNLGSLFNRRIHGRCNRQGDIATWPG